jgi:hypothetical protein
MRAAAITAIQGRGPQRGAYTLAVVAHFIGDNPNRKLCTEPCDRRLYPNYQ